ncbi:M48 family metalloprotease [Archangium sp.]|uniref:M48 family metalloprotease n=1 Tax=Archangium sp. TaxID=1872627 RepID=UPI00286C35EC|nr:M48 family metalloprotease [Archangium sp.]
MNRRQVTSLAACLLMGGLSSCATLQQLGINTGGSSSTLNQLGRVANEHAEASKHNAELRKECDALAARAITIEEEYAFGGAVSVNWVSKGGGLIQGTDAKTLHQQLNKIGKNLAAQSSRPGLAWTFGVLQSEGVNAVSGPGGYVFVTEGLLARLDNEAQLAGVLAHEIAHITGKHAMNEYQTYLVDQCRASVTAEEARTGAKTLGKAVSVVLGPAQVLPPGELRTLFGRLTQNFDFNALGAEAIKSITDGYIARVSKQGFRQQDEYAADREAVELMASAGYAPEQYVAFLEKLPDSGLSTEHPSKQKRQQELNKHLTKLRESAGGDEFTTSVDLSQTKVVPLRDALHAHREALATPTP